MSVFGLLIGFLTLLIIGLGFPLVILSERHLGYICWPYMMGAGVIILLSSLLFSSDWLSAIFGVIGATFVWGSTELKEQSLRVEAGWFPQHPNKIRLPFETIIAKWKAPRL